MSVQTHFNIIIIVIYFSGHTELIVVIATRAEMWRVRLILLEAQPVGAKWSG